MAEIKAQLNYLRIAPRKVRLVASALKGLSVNEAEAQLLFRPQRSSQPLLKLLRSAVANAKNNQRLNADNLVIQSIRVDNGPMLKRFMPRAMGRATPIQKKTSHVSLILEDGKSNSKLPRFNIVIPKKIKEQRGSAPKKIKAMPKMERIEDKPKEKVGFIKKLFQRKSI